MNCPIKCDCLYDRKETEDTVEITFKYMPLLYYVLFVAIIIAFFTMGAWSNVVFFLTFLVFAAYIVMTWKPMEEVRAAMKTKGVKAFGSKLSFNNPPRFVIDK